MSKTTKIELAILLVCIGAVVFSFSLAHRSVAYDGLLHVYFLDVGQGDAMLIQAPGGTQVLIDGGPSSKVLTQLGEVMPFVDHDLDAIVATHTDADHLSGLVDVLGRYKVDHIFETGMQCDTDICKKWEQAAQSEGAERSYVHAGYQLQLDPGTVMTILNPKESVKDQKVPKTNNAGIVMRLDYASQSVLFTADVEKPVEQRLLAEGENLDVDFLKVGHHGSKTSSTQEFLHAVTPKAAFIEVGAHNTYGHPTKEVLDRLEQNGIVVYRTDVSGLTELVLDGTTYHIYTHGNNTPR